VAAVLAFTAFLFARAAAGLPFWYDESLTVRLSRLKIPGELWRALTAGFEFTPPLIYMVTKMSRLLPGPETLTARLPGLVGFGVLVGALFVFLRRRIGSWFATAAVALLPLAEYAIRYAIEARAYMLLLGVSACALVSWESATAGKSKAAPVALALTTACALLLHVWAIILPLALVAGEFVEWVRTRSVRWQVVWPLLAASPVLALYPVLLRSSKTVIFGGPAYEPTLDKLYAAFRSDIPRPRVIAATLLTAAVIGVWRRRGRLADLRSVTSLQATEIAVVLVLLVSPAIPYLYASAAAGAFMTRYALFGLPGMVCLLGAVLHVVGQGERLAGQAATIVALAGVLLYFPPKVPTTGSQSAILETLAIVGPSLDPGVPIVLVNPVDVTAFDEQAADVLRNRALFVADPNRALRYTRTNGIDFGYVRGQPYLNLRVRQLSYGELTKTFHRLYLVGKWQALSWLPQQLQDEGWTMRGVVGGLPQAPVVEARKP
jgi:hypothetical protein